MSLHRMKGENADSEDAEIRLSFLLETQLSD